MKLSKALRRVLAVVVVATALVGVAASASSFTKKQIEVTYRNIKLVVDGVEFTPTDANGKVVEPYISEGSTYVPLRAVGEALGKDVKWDGETNTIYIGKIPGDENNWMKKLPPYQWEQQSKIYDGSDPKQSFSVGGVTHTIGIKLHNYLSNKPYVLWNTDGLYKTMSFTVGSVDGNSTNTTLDIYLDGEFHSTYELKWDAPPQTIVVPLNYAANVKFVLNDHYITYGFYDISFS